VNPVTWPPPWDNFVAAPAGEIPRRPLAPSAGQLDYAHKLLQVVFLGLALIGVTMLLGSQGPSVVLRGAARKHAVQG
jgi:hypothetical protein